MPISPVPLWSIEWGIKDRQIKSSFKVMNYTKNNFFQVKSNFFFYESINRGDITQGAREGFSAEPTQQL